MEALAVEGDDAGGFLAAVLKRVQAERGDRGGVGMAEDAEDAALLAQPVAINVEGDRRRKRSCIIRSPVVVTAVLAPQSVVDPVGLSR